MSDVLDIVQPYLRKIKKSGSDHIVAVCPFHLKPNGEMESNPSFSMSLTSGMFFCFTCQEKGALRTFLHRVGVPRPLIDKYYGSVLENLSFVAPKRDLARSPPFSSSVLPESLLGHFDKCPLDLLDEGFKEEILAQYDIGYDEIHQRITFPLRDMRGSLVGISGRTVVGDWPKYKLYDEEYKAFGYPGHRTDKRIILWNFDRVYPEIFYKPNTSIVLVEGFKACLWLIQSGIKNTVASLGVHISDEQHLMLEHLGATVYIMLDNDFWGRRATVAAARKLSRSLTVKVAEFDENKKQPSDLSALEIESAISNAVDFYAWAMSERNTKWLSERTKQI